MTNITHKPTNKKSSGILNTCKKRPLILAFSSILSLSSATTWAALESKTHADKRATRGLTVLSSAATGALVAGPIGFVVGLAGGALINDQSDRKQEKAIALQQSNESIVDLQQHLLKKEKEVSKLEQLAHARLALEIFFETGIDQPSVKDIEKLKALSLYLLDNKNFKIRLAGHTDHRGSDEYNQVLARERANSVALLLEANGIQRSSLDISAHGDNYASSVSTATQMMVERRVDIDIVFQEQESFDDHIFVGNTNPQLSGIAR